MFALLNANDRSPHMDELQTSPLSASTSNPSSAAPTATTTSSNAFHLKQKRARSQLSCTPCRQGKLKCNRAHDPACDQCMKRNREDQCFFPPPPAKQKPAQNVKGRIRQLENLVVDLMNQNKTVQKQQSKATTSPPDNGDETFSQPTPPSDNDPSPQFTVDSRQSGGSPADDVETAAPLFGQMKISKNEISYVGEAHWDAILSSISDLKRDLGDDEDEDANGTADHQQPESTYNGWGGVPIGGVQPTPTSGLGFILQNGQSRSVTREELIQAVPEKKIADRLLSLWFNSSDPFKPIVHAPAFQDEYRRFWRNPSETPTMWLGLLHAILSLASSFGLRDVDPTSSQAQSVLTQVNKYHSLSAGAAVLGDFTKPKPYTIECLILYSAGLRSNNAFLNVWLMIGLIIRLALRMGYHRDPSHYPAITAFQGEMRRRTWSIISMIDVLISFQLGLPSMVQTIQTDTQPPRNLLDRDFNPSMKALPPGRSIDELTPSSYVRAKLRITRIFANAAELSHATIPPAYEELIQLDRELEEAKAAIPPLLQMPDISELVTDPAEQLMCRFNLDLLYLKTKTVLHRRYMLTPFSQLTREEQQVGIGASRKICINCALRVLRHHHEIFQASQPGGQLDSVKWYMGSISTHDFLLAAMIICLELSNQVTDDQWGDIPGGVKCPQRRELVEVLEKSQNIWSSTIDAKKRREGGQFLGNTDNRRGAHMMDETEKASKAMAVMLQKTKKQFGNRQDHSCTATIHTGASNPTLPPDTSADLATNSPYQPWESVTDATGALINLGNDSNPFTNPAGLNPASIPNGTPHFANANGNTAPSAGVDTSQMDFTMIGDMLDVNANLDWELWDKHFVGQRQNPSSGWDDQMDLTAGNNVMDFGLYGNALPTNADFNQTSLFPDDPFPVPGNAIYPSGLSPLPAGQTAPGLNSQGLDFPSEFTMEDDTFADSFTNGAKGA